MKLMRKTGLAIGAVAGATMLIASAAFASSTLSVAGTTSPVGDVAVTGTNVGTLSFGTNALPSVPASCTTSTVAGTVRRGASVTAGQQIGKISSLVFGTSATPCTATTLNYPVLISKNTNTGSTDWPIVVTATPAKGAATVPIQITNVDVKLQSVAKTGSPASYICDLRVQGTVTGTFNQTNQQITITPATATTYSLNSIVAYDGNGTKTAGSGITCAGQIYTGDRAKMSGGFTLTAAGTGGIHW